MTVIELKNITKVFSPDNFFALNDVSIAVKQGECILIGGANGSGKSMLMSIIAELKTPTSGTVSTTEKVGLVFQDADTQILGETPEEDIAFGLKNLKIPKNQHEEIIQRVMAKTGLLKRKGFPARFLSGGEKRRLATASMLAMDCPILIFDEPYANLDFEGVKHVNELLAMLKEENHTVIILTHELEKCYALADRFIVLFEGKKVFDGTPDDGLTQDLEKWSIRNPLCAYKSKKDLLW